MSRFCLKNPEVCLVGRGRQADQVGIEVFQHLLPQSVDRPMTLVDEDHVELVGWQKRVVTHHDRLRRQQFVDRLLVQFVVQILLALQDGKDALHRGDAAREVVSIVFEVRCWTLYPAGNFR